MQTTTIFGVILFNIFLRGYSGNLWRIKTPLDRYCGFLETMHDAKNEILTKRERFHFFEGKRCPEKAHLTQGTLSQKVWPYK